MSIANLVKIGTLVEEETSNEEIKELLRMVERDIEDSSKTAISLDWQFGIAYNGALKLASILARASGVRAKGNGHHMNTISIIPLILGKAKQKDANYLEACRKKRNTVEYEYIGGATAADVKEIQEFIQEFKEEVLAFIKEKGIKV